METVALLKSLIDFEGEVRIKAHSGGKVITCIVKENPLNTDQVFYLFVIFFRGEIGHNADEADTDVLCGDWDAIGKDLRECMSCEMFEKRGIE